MLKSAKSKLSKFLGGSAETREALDTLQQSTKLREEDRDLLKKVSPKIHFRDQMFVPGHAGHYVETGLSALSCIEKSLKACGAPPPKDILDLPCGHGRVLRFIAARFPKANITAADLDNSGVKFCAKTFGAAPFISSEQLDTVEPGKFDLIWSGSLLTHFNKKDIRDVLALFNRSLKPGGVCVFSTHGEHVAYRIRYKNFTYSIDIELRAELLRQYDVLGFGYVDYPNAENYGVSIITREELLKITGEFPDWKECLFMPAGWRDHQDVYAFRKDRRED